MAAIIVRKLETCSRHVGQVRVCLIPRVPGIVAEIKSIAAIDNWDTHGVEELRESVRNDSFEITCVTMHGLTIKFVGIFFF